MQGMSKEHAGCEYITTFIRLCISYTASHIVQITGFLDFPYEYW